MTQWNLPLLILLLLRIAFLSAYSIHASPDLATGDGGVASRRLLSLKETPHGSNLTFDCSPSGPCVPCLYSEKNDEKYRCSETGYRIPLKCVEVKEGVKDESGEKTQNARSTIEISVDNEKLPVVLAGNTLKKYRCLLEDSSKSEGGSQAYITYRSCIPAVNEEKVSVLGFEEVIILCKESKGLEVFGKC